MIEFKYKEYKISIFKSTIDVILKYRQVDYKFESGGMLIGSIIDNLNEIEIIDCTEPLKEDFRNRLSFSRSNKHNDILKRKWKESNFTKLYLGEWHTHPQQIPLPSTIDKISWTTLLLQSNTESKILVFIIMGTTSMEIWIGDRISQEIERGGSYRF